MHVGNDKGMAETTCLTTGHQAHAVGLTKVVFTHFRFGDRLQMWSVGKIL